MISARRPKSGVKEELLPDLFRWSTVIGATALAAGLAAAGQAFRGNGSDEIVFGPMALFLLALAAVALPRALRTADSDSTVPFIGSFAFAAGVDSNMQIVWWLDVALTLLAFAGLSWLRSRLRQPATARKPEGAADDAADPC